MLNSIQYRSRPNCATQLSNVQRRSCETPREFRIVFVACPKTQRRRGRQAPNSLCETSVKPSGLKNTNRCSERWRPPFVSHWIFSRRIRGRHRLEPDNLCVPQDSHGKATHGCCWSRQVGGTARRCFRAHRPCRLHSRAISARSSACLALRLADSTMSCGVSSGRSEWSLSLMASAASSPYSRSNFLRLHHMLAPSALTPWSVSDDPEKYFATTAPRYRASMSYAIAHLTAQEQTHF